MIPSQIESPSSMLAATVPSMASTGVSLSSSNHSRNILRVSSIGELGVGPGPGAGDGVGPTLGEAGGGGGGGALPFPDDGDGAGVGAWTCAGCVVAWGCAVVVVGGSALAFGESLFAGAVDAAQAECERVLPRAPAR